MRVSNAVIRAGAVLTLAVALLLTGCAGPRFATEMRYVPPGGEAGEACLQGCHIDMQACRADCQSRRESCIEGIEPRVDTAFERVLRQYEADRKLYLRELQFYRLERAVHFGFYHHPFYYGTSGPFWHTDRYLDDPPIPPIPPSRAGIRQQVIAEHCEIECGCQARFDQCYLGCGGRIEREVLCIENCDDVAPAMRRSGPVEGEGP